MYKNYNRNDRKYILAVRKYALNALVLWVVHTVYYFADKQREAIYMMLF